MHLSEHHIDFAFREMFLMGEIFLAREDKFWQCILLIAYSGSLYKAPFYNAPGSGEHGTTSLQIEKIVVEI